MSNMLTRTTLLEVVDEWVRASEYCCSFKMSELIVSCLFCQTFEATAYASFLSEIWTGEYSILAPRTLKQTVGFFAPQFNNNYQHDR